MGALLEHSVGRYHQGRLARDRPSPMASYGIELELRPLLLCMLDWGRTLLLVWPAPAADPVRQPPVARANRDGSSAIVAGPGPSSSCPPKPNIELWFRLLWAVRRPDEDCTLATVP